MTDAREPFFIEDQGDGWWHCASPLICKVIDGPGPRMSTGLDDGSATFWLVTTEPAIEWNGDQQFASMWGPDSPLCHPIRPTHLALVYANGVSLDDRGSVPVYPVLNLATCLADARSTESLGVKAYVHRRGRTT